MSTIQKIFLAFLIVAPLAAVAHAPSSWVPPWEHNPTQNMISGPIKRRPVNPFPPPPSAGESSGVELRPGNGNRFSTMHVTAVFLGAPWRSSRFASDKVAGMEQFFRGYPGSTYAASIDEYVGNGAAGTAANIVYEGYTIEDRVQLEVESPGQIGALLERLYERGDISIRQDGSSYLMVYSARKRPSWEPCGWHGWKLGGSGGGFYFSFIYDLDKDSACDVRDSEVGHSQGLEAMANTTARALVDIQTDLRFGGWLDKAGNEVDDKCAWIFSVPYVTFPDGSKWTLQDLWSNAAYEAGTGNSNAQGQRGCVTGR